MMHDILIKNGLIYLDHEFIRMNIGISGNRITYTGRQEVHAGQTIDASGCAVLPGVMNAHTHLSMCLLRGVAEDQPLERWLSETVWPIEKKLSARDIYYGSLLGIYEMLRTGTTCFSDLYIEMDMTARAVLETGIRACLCYGMADRGDESRGREELRIGREFVKKWHQKGTITALYGPHSTYTCTPEFLKEVKEVADNDGLKVQIHASENSWEIDEVRKKYGMTPVELLNSIGFLDENTILAHCVRVSDSEIEIIKRRKAHIVHNPISNLKLSAGIAPVFKFVLKGINVALGTDGAASNNSYNMFEEIKITPLLQKCLSGNASALKAYESIDMATKNGYRAYGLEGGEIKEGKLADIVIIDVSSPSYHPSYNLINNIVYSGNGYDVRDVIVDGKIVVEKGKVLTIDREKIIDKVERIKRRIMDNGQENTSDKR